MSTNIAPYPTDLLAFGAITFVEPMDLPTFTNLCEQYPDLQAEREANGKVVIMSPVKSGSGENESHLVGYLYSWNLLHGKPGKVYSPSAGFLLAGDEIRCGDAIWVSNDRLAPFLAKPNHRNEWINVAPDFVIEVKSDSDRINKLKKKMVEVWLANNVLLAWLIDPDQEVAYIYRQGRQEPKEVRGFDTSILSGEDVLPGFEFPLVELNL